jgi:hypothetical protein
MFQLDYKDILALVLWAAILCVAVFFIGRIILRKASSRNLTMYRISGIILLVAGLVLQVWSIVEFVSTYHQSQTANFITQILAFWSYPLTFLFCIALFVLGLAFDATGIIFFISTQRRNALA